MATALPPFSPAGRVQAMLHVEVALAEALAEAGVIPETSVAPIRSAARVERFDLGAIDAEAKLAGNPVIPLVRHLIQAVASQDAAAAGHVHWGATSQDVMDTALVLQMRQAGSEIAAHTVAVVHGKCRTTTAVRVECRASIR